MIKRLYYEIWFRRRYFRVLGFLLIIIEVQNFEFFLLEMKGGVLAVGTH